MSFNSVFGVASTKGTILIAEVKNVAGHKSLVDGHQ
jgi:hypothetical protein